MRAIIEDEEMSEDERYIDKKSDAEKKAHHNALERQRRDRIKDSFSELKDYLPPFQGDKASRANILRKAAVYIQSMRRKNLSSQKEIDDAKKLNKILEEQIQQLEEAKTTGNYAAAASILDSHINNSKVAMNAYDVDSESDGSSNTDGSKDCRRKKNSSQVWRMHCKRE